MEFSHLFSLIDKPECLVYRWFLESCIIQVIIIITIIKFSFYILGNRRI